MFDLYDLLMLTINSKKRKGVERDVRSAAYFDLLLRIDVAMWQYDGIDLYQARWLERYLTTTGSVGIQQRDGKIMIAPDPSRISPLDEYGDGTQMIGVLRNGETQLQGTVGVDCVVGYNNSDRTPDLDLLYYPRIMANLDAALDVNVDLSKAAPIFGVDNDVTRKTLEAALQKIREGVPQVVLSDNVLKSLSKTASSPGIYSVHLTDPDTIRNAQYIAELWDILLRRFCNARGIDTRKTTKHAQVSTAEATGMEAVSWILPIDMLRSRQQMCEEVNRLCGTTWQVGFAEPWASQWLAYQANLIPREEETGNDDQADHHETDDPADEPRGDEE
jgi:hypothetical protein